MGSGDGDGAAAAIGWWPCIDPAGAAVAGALGRLASGPAWQALGLQKACMPGGVLNMGCM